MVKNIFTKTNLILLREAIKSFLMKFPTLTLPLHEKCPNTKFFLVRISPHLDWIRRDTYSVWMQENTDQKKLRIWTIFTQWQCQYLFNSRNESTMIATRLAYFDNWLTADSSGIKTISGFTGLAQSLSSKCTISCNSQLIMWHYQLMLF